MSVEVMAWNVLDAFSDEKRARGVLEVLHNRDRTLQFFLKLIVKAAKH